MAFLFMQPTIIVPILLIVIILMVVAGIIALFVKKMRERRRKMKASFEKMKKINSLPSVLKVSKNYRKTYK
jgi:heme/copper-type cytochrome/quinol oxidase subunit 2